MGVVRIAAAAAHFGRDLDKCLERVGLVIGAARRVNAAVLVLPDGALGGHLTGDPAGSPDDLAADGHPAEELPAAIDLDGPQLRRVASLAGPLVVCLGIWERGTGGERWNTAVCLTGDGVLGRYRKVHLSETEAVAHQPGDGFATFDSPIGRMGMLIDRDKSFPEAARTLALNDAAIIACLSAWPASLTQRVPRLTQDRQSRLFDLYDCARAAENQVVWVSANQTGSIGALRFLGQSKVVAPNGEVLARTWGKAGLAVAELDVDAEVARAREVARTLLDRRPDLYRAR